MIRYLLAVSLAVLPVVAVSRDIRLSDGTYEECPERCVIVAFWDEFYEVNPDKIDLLWMMKHRMLYADWRDVYLNNPDWIWQYLSDYD